MRRIWVPASVLIAVLAASSSHAWRCGNLLVRPGVQKAAVLLYCGEPAYREELGTRDGKARETLIYGPQWGMYYLLTFKGTALATVESKRAR